MGFIFISLSGVLSNNTVKDIPKKLKGVYNVEDPPLSIPNREVKLHGADGTALWWESRLAPNLESPGEIRGFLFLFSPADCADFADWFYGLIAGSVILVSGMDFGRSDFG